MPPSVLLFDAFSEEREMYMEYLLATGFRVRPFDDLDEAVAAAAEAPPTVVVARLRLPNRQIVATSLIERLKANPALRGVPVLVIATSMLQEEREAVLAAGGDRYVLLPCLPEELVAEIDRLLTHAPRQIEPVWAAS